MTEQITQHKTLFDVSARHSLSAAQDEANMTGSLDEAELEWWADFRSHTKAEERARRRGKSTPVKIEPGQKPLAVEEFEVPGKFGFDDLRIVVKVSRRDKSYLSIM